MVDLPDRLAVGELDLLVTRLDRIDTNGNSLLLFHQQIALAVTDAHPLARQIKIYLSIFILKLYESDRSRLGEE
jgi:DNA-binding transcriptional LysR family regulator